MVYYRPWERVPLVPMERTCGYPVGVRPKERVLETSDPTGAPRKGLRGFWAVLALIALWTLMYFVLTRSVPKRLRHDDPQRTGPQRLAPILGPQDGQGAPPRGPEGGRPPEPGRR